VNGLESESAGKRTAAATTLGDLRYLHTFKPLLDALARESEPGFGDRAVKAAILEALDNVGSDHCRNPKLEIGREPLKRFSMAHLDDAGLVRAALEASGWTVSIMGDAIQDLDEVKEAARSAAAKGGPDAEKYRATDGAAVNLYFDWIRSR
jgi:L-alanine-DL-glutamate epimerase-like enolase superfamily enzyme